MEIKSEYYWRVATCHKAATQIAYLTCATKKTTEVGVVVVEDGMQSHSDVAPLRDFTFASKKYCYVKNELLQQ